MFDQFLNNWAAVVSPIANSCSGELGQGKDQWISFIKNSHNLNRHTVEKRGL